MVESRCEQYRMDRLYSRAVSLIYDAAAEPSVWPLALQACADVFGDVGAVLVWRREDEGFGVIVSPSLQAGQEEFERHWWRLDIRTIRGAEKLYAAGRDVLCDHDVVTQEDPGAALKPFAIERPKPLFPLIAYCFPAARAMVAAETLLTRARALILLFELKSDEPADPATIRDILGLTLGEARVATLVAYGMAPKAAAEKLGIAESTARTVLKKVFQKVGVSRQSELAALLNRIATLAAVDEA